MSFTIARCGSRLNIFINFKLFFGTSYLRRGYPELVMKQRDEEEGELGAPNLWICFLACQLQYLKGWGAAGYNGPVYNLLHAITKGRGLMPPLEAGFLPRQESIIQWSF